MFVPLMVFAQTEPPQFVTVDGRLYDSTTPTDPLLDASVALKIQVLNPAKTCILYEEQQSVNTLSSNGYFNIRVGSPTAGADSLKRSANDSGNTMMTVFQNQNSMITGKTSAGMGCSYTPSSGDSRYFRFEVTPSTTGVTSQLSPDMTIDSVPQALVAESLQGLSTSDFVQISANVTQAKLESLLGASYTTLTGLLAGTSSLYLQNTVNGTVIPNRATNPATPIAGQIWYDSASNVMKYYDGSTVQTIGTGGGDPTKLPLAGGTMTGGIAMGSNDITAVGHITQSAQRTFRFGGYTGGQETTLVGGLLAGQEGTAWYNTTTDKLMYWDGTASQEVLTTASANSLVPNCTATQSLQMSAGPVYVWSCVATTDSSKLPLAGGTMTGAINMGSNDITASGHITLSAQRTLRLGSYTTIQQGTLVAGLVAGQEGTSWYNSDTEKMMYWDGTAAREVVDATQLTGLGDITDVVAGNGLTGGAASGSATLDIGAGAGISVAADSISVNINGTTAETTADNADEILVYDTSATALRKMTRSNFLTGYLTSEADTLATVTGRGASTGTDITLNAQTDLRFADSAGGEYAAIQAPATIGANYTLTLPDTDGNNLDVLQTDGNGVLSWVAIPSAPVTSVHGRTGVVVSANGDYTASQVTNVAAGSVAAVTVQAAIDELDTEKVPTTRTITTTASSSGLSGGGDLSSNRSLSVDITGTTAETAVAGADELLIWDASASALRKMTRTNFVLSEAEVDAMVANNGYLTAEADTLATVTGRGASTATNIVMSTEAAVRFEDNAGGQYVGIKSPATVATSFTLVLPDNDGNNLDVLQTDGNGVLSWVAVPSAPVTSVHGRTGVVVSANGDYTASQVTNVAAGTVAAVTVQAAIDELDTEKVPTARTITTTASSSGLSGGGDLSSNRSLSVDITGTTAETTVAGADELLIWDASASALRKMTRTNFVLSEAEVDAMVSNNGYLTAEADTLATVTGRGASTGTDITLNAQTDLRFADSAGGEYAAIQAPATIGANYTLTLPTDDGTSGQYLQTDGNGVLSWVTPSGVGETNTASNVTSGGGIGLFKQKSTYDLEFKSLLAGSTKLSVSSGASDVTLDVVETNLNLGNIPNTAAGNIAATNAQAAINELDTEKVAKAGDSMTGALTMNAQNQVRYADAAGGEYAAIQAPTTIGANYTLTLPANDGNNLDVLQTDGNGVLSWVAIPSAPVTSVHGRTGVVVSANGDYTASQVTNVAAGTVAATTAQAAIDELDSEKVAKAGDTMTGLLTMNPRGVAAGDGGAVGFKELAASGTNTATIRSPDTLAADYVLTLPTDDGTSGQFLQTDGSGVLSWASAPAPADDSLDFTHFSDTMTLDASTDIAASGTNVLSITNSGTGNSFVVNDATGDTSPFVIDASGNVGIGTSSPNTSLHVRHPTLATATVNSLLVSRWTRGQTGGVKYGNAFDINLGSYGTSISSQSRVDFNLANGATDLPDQTVMTLLGSGNVGLGTVSPSQKLEIRGAAGSPATSGSVSTGLFRISNVNNGLALDIGQEAGAPYTSWIQNTNGSDLTQIFPIALNPNGGAVGIGTTIPGTVLDVAGSITSRPHGTATGATGKLIMRELAANGTNTATIRSPDTLAADYVLTLPVDDGTSGQVLQTDGNGVLSWTAPSATIADDSLNFDKFSDTMTLDASTDIAATGSEVLSITNSGTGNSFVVNDQASDTSPFVVDASGNVGIGTSTPTHLLTVETGSGGLPGVLALKGPFGSADTGTQLMFRSSGNVDYARIAGARGTASNNGYLSLIVQDAGVMSEKMRINSSGNIGIGTATPGTLLDVAGAITSRPFGTASGETGQIIMRELAANGTNTATIRSPDTLAADYVLTLPVDDGTSGQVLQTDGNGVLSWTAPSATIADDSLNFDKFSDTLALDASTDIAIDNAEVLSITNTGSANSFVVNDAASDTSPFVIDATGNVGVGTTAPSEKLDVLGKVKIGNGTQSAVLGIAQYDVNPALDIIYPVDGGLRFGGGASFSDGAAFQGFGGTNSSFPGEMYFDYGSTARIIPGRKAVWRNLTTGPTYTTVMTLDANSNVGIGTTAPGTVLDVAGSITSRPHGTATGETGKLIMRELAASGTNTATIRSPDTLAADYVLTLPVDDGTSGQVLQTDGSGVLSWVNSPAPTADSLDFTHFSDTMTLDASTNIAATGTNVLSITNSGTGNSFLVNDEASDTSPFVIDASGNVGIGSTAPVGILDVRGGTADTGLAGTNINIVAQNAGATGPASGGGINLLGGYSSGDNSTAGGINITGGSSYGNQSNAGSVIISGGVAAVSGARGGSVTVQASSGNGANRAGGTLTLRSGSTGGGNSNGSDVDIISGAGSGASGVGGNINITGLPGGVARGNLLITVNRVGIGTSTPGTLLDVAGAITSQPFGTASGETGQIIMRELAASGTNTATIRSPDTLAADYVLTLPVDDGTSGQVLQTDGNGVLSWTAAGIPSADSLDFTHFSDTMTLDASTDVAVTGSNVLSVTNSGSGNSFRVNDDSGDTTPFIIDTNGNVGVGTTAAGAALQIGEVTGVASPRQIYVSEFDASGTGRPAFVANWGASGGWGIGPVSLGSSSTIQLGSVGGPDNDWDAVQSINFVVVGNVGVGTTSPGTALDVAGAITSRPHGTATGETGKLIMRELAANGTNTATIRSPDTLAADYVLTLPVDDGTSGQVLQTDGNGVLSWTAAGTPSADSLDFTHFSDTMTLDASTDVAVTGSNVLSVTNSGTGNSFRVNDDSGDTSPFVIDASGNVGIGTSVPTSILGVSGSAAQTMGMERNPTADTVGNSLTIRAGGASSGASNKVGGDLNLSAGISTGTGSATSSRVNLLSTRINGANPATTDMVPETVMSAGWSWYHPYSVDVRIGYQGGHPAPLGVGLDTAGAVYSSTSASSRYVSSHDVAGVSVMQRTGLDGNYASYEMIAANGSGNQQTGYMATVSTTGAGAYTPSLVFGTSTGASARTERMRIDTSGNMGIGTTTPGTLLDVAGAITSRPFGTSSGNTGQIIMRELAANGTNTATIRSPDTLAADYVLTLPVDDGTSGQVLQTDGSGVLSWVAAGSPSADSLDFTHFSDTMTLDASTDVAVTGSNVLSVTNSGTGNSFRVNDASGDTTPFVIDASGNVGVGTTTASTALTVNGSAIIGTNNNSASGASSLTVGDNSHATGDSSLSVGSGSIANGYGSAAFGEGSAYGSYAVGANGSRASGDYSFAIGKANTGSGFAGSGGNYSVAIGAGNPAGSLPYVSGNGSVGIFMGDQSGASVTTDNVMTILGGSVGIGTTVPGTLLDVAGAITSRPHGTAAGETGKLIMRELAASGTNTVTIRSPDTLGADYILTLPTDDGTSGQVLSTDGNGVLSWIAAGSPGADSLNFTDFSDALALDASTDIAVDNAEVLSITNTGSANSFVVNDESSDTSPFVIDTSGNVGIGTTTAASKLAVNGVVSNSVSTFSGALTCGSSTLDFSTSNLQRLSPSGTVAAGTCSVALSNLVAGASYTLVVTGNAAVNAVTYNFTGYTFKYLPANTATTGGKDTIYTFLYDGTTVYVTWSGGY